MMFIDTHCHINDEHLLPDEDDVYSAASEAGVGVIVNIGWDEPSSKVAIELAKRHKNSFAAIGYHPCNLEGFSLSAIKELAKEEGVIAIGEIGLDYHWVKDPLERENQKKAFIAQIELANELGLPVSIHARDAALDTLEILKAHPLEKGGVMHCYSGSAEMLREFVKLGLYIGFDGPLTYKNSVGVKENARVCPLDRILTETDSPYLPPVPHRGETNYPKYIPLIAKEIAAMKGISLEEVEKAVNENFERLFHVKL